ncbi:uncharacterized protein LOC130799130 isoform X2 [Amaranthus tricolor]|uniref:uncharacterized protein LOC130799130 isoform X2 n=1 Tax=Amaranthus tricolor TaxID=29722 RepID=UPI002587DF15|nr:uncharacterized protein LOC130799130 isoform X2 [Amaranthus tricolor]
MQTFISVAMPSQMSAALKEAIDDLEWPGSSIKLTLQPTPPSVAFRSEGHGDLQIDFMYYANTDLLAALSCDREVSHRQQLLIYQVVSSKITVAARLRLGEAEY